MVNLASKTSEQSVNKYLAASAATLDANTATPTDKAYKSESEVKKILNIAAQVSDFNTIGVPLSMDELAAKANQITARKYAELESSD